jgi:hypothetical protein
MSSVKLLLSLTPNQKRAVAVGGAWDWRHACTLLLGGWLKP